MIAGRGRSVERALALAPVKTPQVAAAERDPDDALGVDVAAADSIVGRGDVVELGECGLGRVRPGIDPHYPGLAAEHADGSPDGVVRRVWHHRVETGAAGNALVLRRIDRL